MLAFDAAGSNTGVLTNTVISWNHVVGAGSTLLVVSFGGYSDNAMTVSSVTIGASNLVHLGGQGMNTAFADFQDVWYLINPPSGSATITVTFGQTANDVSGGSTSWTGGDTAVGVRNFTTNSNAGSAQTSTTVTCANGNIANDFIQFSSSTETATPDNGASRFSNMVDANSRTGSSSLASSGTSVTLTWTITTSRQWYTCGWEIVAGANPVYSVLPRLNLRPGIFQPGGRAR